MVRKIIQRLASPRIIENLQVLYLALKRKDTPGYAKLAAFAALLYALFPVDFVPDFFPFLGFFDDILVAVLLILMAFRLVPNTILMECRDEVTQRDLIDVTPRKQNPYFLLKILLLLGVSGLIVFWLFPWGMQQFNQLFTLSQQLLLYLLIGFYGAYFIQRVHLRRQNHSVQELAQQRYIEPGLLAVTFFLAVLQFSSCIFGQNMPWSIVPPFGVQIAGLILASLGLLFFVLAFLAMGNNWRVGINPGQNTQMVTWGIYRWSRNPTFLGFDLLYLGSALVFPNPLLVLGVGIGILLLHRQIIAEEEYLAQVFGAAYTGYQKVTKRYLFLF